MSRIFITGSADGLGLAAARSLLAQGHEVVIHARSRQRLEAVGDLVRGGACAVVGDLAQRRQLEDLAAEVNRLGRMDAVIHNAGVYTGDQILAVNVIAPYVLSALVSRPERLITISSAMHLRGNPVIAGVDWAAHGAAVSYADSKLYVTALANALARRWPEVVSSAVDPGWVPTRMGGPDAPDDLALGHATQEWLATSADPQARVSGGYWHHGRRLQAHAVSRQAVFQDELLGKLEALTGITLPVS